jgi:uncharacterized protein (TIGR03083 family)
MNPNFLDHLQNDLNRINTLAAGDLSVPVPGCPGWDLGRLVGHLGRVHRMALAVVSTGSMSPAAPADLAAPPDDHDALRAYFSESAAQLMNDLATTPLDAPCWTFLGTGDVTAFWHRRLAHEHSVHRYDAELAVGTPSPIPADLAIDGVNEYFIMSNVRLLPKKLDFDLGGTIHLHATDSPDGEWMIEQTGSFLTVSHGHGKGDAAVRGTASDLLLGLWGRKNLTGTEVFEHFGNQAITATLASLGGS